MFGLGWGFQHTQSNDLVVDSPVFSDHVELQVMGFMGPAFINWDGSSQFPKLDKIEIKKERLIVSYGTSNKELSMEQRFNIRAYTPTQGNCLFIYLLSMEQRFNIRAYTPTQGNCLFVCLCGCISMEQAI